MDPALLKPNIPPSFTDFWHSITKDAMQYPLNYKATSILSEVDTEHHTVYNIEFNGIKDEKRHGWIAIPKEIQQNEQCPAFIWLNPYGSWSTPPNKYTTRPGYISLSFNFHGLPSIHDEKYSVARGYFTNGIESRNTFTYKYFYQDAILAARILQDHPNVDRNRISCMGLSQGGGMSIWMNTFCPIIQSACADLPFFVGVEYILSHRFYRYPIKEIPDYLEKHNLNLDDILNETLYFDTLNIATFNKNPLLISLGLKDPACKPEAIRALYENVSSEKQLIEYPGGHDYDQHMVQNNLNWVNNTLQNRMSS